MSLFKLLQGPLPPAQLKEWKTAVSRSLELTAAGLLDRDPRRQKSVPPESLFIFACYWGEPCLPRLLHLLSRRPCRSAPWGSSEFAFILEAAVGFWQVALVAWLPGSTPNRPGQRCHPSVWGKPTATGRGGREPGAAGVLSSISYCADAIAARTTHAVGSFQLPAINPFNLLVF